MTTAWESLKDLGVAVPEWKQPAPENREEARDEFRKALARMQDEYRDKTQGLRHPSVPGPRPKQYAGAPEFPHAFQYPPEPPRPGQPIGLTRYPSSEEISAYIAVGGPTSNALPGLASTELRAKAVADWQDRMQVYEAAVEEYRPRWKAVHDQEQATLREYAERNNEWLDTVFYPGEAERAVWEVAHEVYEESLRAIRAEADLARDEFDILRAQSERKRLEQEAGTPDSTPKT